MLTNDISRVISNLVHGLSTGEVRATGTTSVDNQEHQVLQSSNDNPTADQNIPNSVYPQPVQPLLVLLIK